ncbi:MAG TPA: crossover junction endodeoxyribonuclease RuvC [Burkholderiales bacterium]|nr:crossover junction endodeoxyribonuclease RuvC [Burkholderiales bacterium]
MTTIIGFDPSLSHSAAHWAPRADLLEGAVFGGYGTFAIKSEPKHFAHRLARLQEIRRQLLDHVHSITKKHGAGVMFVEGYAFGARNDRETLGEWGGQLRLTMFDLGWDVVEVAPGTLKKYVTGKGNAEKDGIRMEVLKRWRYESTDNNDADAYALMRLGFDWLRWRDGVQTTKALAETCAKLVVLRHDAKVELPQKKPKRRKLAGVPVNEHGIAI